ncbi:MAG TPA: DUF3857 domain-containing protein [Kofleriaceae bacterium]
MWGRFWVGMFVVSSVASGWASGTSLAAPPTAPKATADRALDKPAFTAAPGELLALGKAAPTGDWSMVVLRAQRDVSYDDQGRATVRARRVYVVQAGAGGDDDDDDDDAIHAEWHPSYQDKPVIRARVITPEGKAVELDPARITELPGSQRAANAAGDRRYLQAPLPPAKPGAVVEQEIVTTDREPPPAGTADTTPIGSGVPTSSTVISYSAPVAARIHHVERKLPAGARVRHQVANGREVWIHEIPALPARFDQEFDAPADVVQSPYVGVGTGASWEAVARAYRKLLDRRIAEGPFDLPAELGHDASVETVHAIVAWVHHHVHGSGAGFGDAARIPLSPAETVKQAAGDDGDRATLVVALLRQAGIRAEVALLASRFGQKPDPDLPGLGGFDRAIVRAQIGGRELWIDPAQDLARPGQLPEHEQGQRVLVIAEDTKALAMTPAAASADNLVREVRTFVAAEHGPSQLTQVVRYTGVFEAEARDQARVLRTGARKRVLGRQAEAQFGGTLDQVASSDPEDLTRPYEVTTTVKDAHRVITEFEQIDLYLSPQDALEHLPWIVTRKPDKPRTSDFAWPRPHVYEIENRIAVPPGFTPPAAAPDRVRRLGTATLTEHQQVDGQTLIVGFRLDTGKVRLTPAELAALQAALQELHDETVHVRIDHTAFALGNAGKPREAIAEGERLIALHPAEALHHSQLATVLLRAGAGEAARREARKAVAMAPADAGALVVLGWVLSFDTLGRAYTYNWDRAGAIAALEKARKLDPKRLGAAVSLAHVLERDPSGRLYENADLSGAAEAWRAALELDKTDEHALALARVLVWSGDFAGAEKVARTAKDSEERDKWIVTAIACSGGAQAAIQAAGGLRSGASRNQLLTGAGWTMLLLQRYDLARELLSESGILASAPAAVATMMNKLKKHPDLQLRAADPRSTVLDLFAAVIDPQHKTPAFWDAELESEFRSTNRWFLPAPLRTSASRWFGDILQSMLDIAVEGDAGVWRATVEADHKKIQLYLVLDRGVVKLVGATDALAGVGRYILRGGDAKADARARTLLDWIHADNDKATWSNVVLFKRLWGPGVPSTRDAIRLAAAHLAGETDPDRVIAVAAPCASTLPDAELACHKALFLAYRARGRWPEAVAQSEAILALEPSSAAARVQIHAWALARAGRFEDADRALDEVLAKDPDHHGARLARFEIAALRGSPADVVQRGDALLNHPAATAWNFNYVAWYRLGMGGDLAPALEIARKGVDKAPRDSGGVNTLAAIEAEMGDLDRAIRDNWKAMGLHSSVEPDDGDWYVVGRIDEQLGLAKDAAAAYKRVTRPRVDQLLSVYTLAQRRLAALAAAH